MKLDYTYVLEVNEYGSFSAKLSDGIALSFSCFGDNGLNPNIGQSIECDVGSPSFPFGSFPTPLPTI